MPREEAKAENTDFIKAVSALRTSLGSDTMRHVEALRALASALGDTAFEALAEAEHETQRFSLPVR